MRFADNRPEGKGYFAYIHARRLKPVFNASGEAYVCRVCGTELLYKKRKFKYYGNKVIQTAEWCPICLKFRDVSTRILQSQYYEGMRGRIKYYGMK